MRAQALAWLVTAVLVGVPVLLGAPATASGQDAREADEAPADAEEIPEAPGEFDDDATRAPDETGLGAEAGAIELADPFGLARRAHELDAILAADASGAANARTLGAVMGYVLGALGIGSTPIFFAIDDGTGLFPILSILPLQLGTLSLATAILGSVTLSTEERRYASWQRLGEHGGPSLEDVARHEGFLVADADRAADARLFSLAQGIAGIATGIFTGVVGLALSRVELTQITLGTLGGIELLLGFFQLLGALDAGDVESRPGRYESRTGVQLSMRGSALVGVF